MTPGVGLNDFKMSILGAAPGTQTGKVRKEFPHSGDRKNDQRVIEVPSGPALACQSIEDWLQPNCAHYMAMHVPRPRTWGDLQPFVDALARSEAFRDDDSIQEEVQMSSAWDSEQRLAADLTDKAQRLSGLVALCGLPKHAAQQIEADFRQIGMVMAKIAPATRMLLKLDIMGENCCSKWHQDKYTARAIISYNLCGTEYVDNGHSQLYSAKVGDVLLMKGTTFPSEARGLVHRSPPVQYDPNGKAMHRLCLKVDLP